MILICDIPDPPLPFHPHIILSPVYTSGVAEYHKLGLAFFMYLQRSTITRMNKAHYSCLLLWLMTMGILRNLHAHAHPDYSGLYNYTSLSGWPWAGYTIIHWWILQISRLSYCILLLICNYVSPPQGSNRRYKGYFPASYVQVLM